uniref:Prion-inhibition and propagation HeLo domain-containing protein n=1 Tax=Bionectria ochroleuca TaxID=29856 RepID=A0A8H7K4B8_BIOOC
MDPVGIAGLGGLFASVMDAIDRAKDYRSFAADSRTLDAQFDGFGAQLAHWGKEIGIDHGQFPVDHKAKLDPQTLSAAEQLLQVAKEVLALGESSRARAKVLTGQPLSNRPAPASRKSDGHWEAKQIGLKTYGYLARLCTNYVNWSRVSQPMASRWAMRNR